MPGSGFGGPCDVCKSAGKESAADGTSEDDNRRISGVVRSHFTTDGCKAAGGKRNRLPQSVSESDARLSADEDLLIPKEQFEACQEAMLLYGMQQLNPETGTENYGDGL